MKVRCFYSANKGVKSFIFKLYYKHFALIHCFINMHPDAGDVMQNVMHKNKSGEALYIYLIIVIPFD
jgi:hypothetical protein